MHLSSVNNVHSFGSGVKISSEIADAIGQKPKFVQKYVANSLNKMDKFAKTQNLDVIVRENRLINGLYSLRAEYVGKNINGFVFQPSRKVTLFTIPHLTKELKKDVNGPLIESMKKFLI